VTPEGGAGSGQSHSMSYRLDNEWILTCWFQNEGDILIERELSHALKHIWVNPPKGFTGKWITFFVNGQKSHEINYRNGKYFGELISYHSDGSRNFVQHYTEKGADGADTGYYPSGKIAYRAQYRDNKQAGTWIWYDESGRVTSTKEYTTP
jgi:antitoxin component YwqK of YwqJK toxin-antitoxin module